MKRMPLILTVPFVLAACVNPEKVTENKVTDVNMTCQEIANESAQINKLKEEAKKGTGMSGANVAAVLVFWPAAVGNYVNGKDALEAAQKREVTLAKLAQSKNCNIKM